MCKAASIPASTVPSFTVPYFGRKIKVAGDRTYDPWTITVINDEDFLVRNAMEEWSHAINKPQQNKTELTNPNDYKTQAQVTQFGKDGIPLRIYNFNGVWPSAVSEIALAWDTNDTIEEFTVTLEYDWWSVAAGITGRAGGE
jgi:hypothetical protein